MECLICNHPQVGERPLTAGIGFGPFPHPARVIKRPCMDCGKHLNLEDHYWEALEIDENDQEKHLGWQCCQCHARDLKLIATPSL